MPAIQLARLKKQAARLADVFHDPPAFRGALFEVLDYYADRTRRHGQAGEPPPLRTAYNVPAPVIRQIVKELSVFAANYPESSLSLCDYLWGQAYFEENLLAAHLLGHTRLANPEPVLERVHNWLASKPESRLVKAILEYGLAGIRQSAPEQFVRALEGWVKGANPYQKQVGLKAMLLLIDQPGFDDLNFIFRLINPLIRSSPAEIQADAIDVLRALARHTPVETAYNLRVILDTSEGLNNAAWFIRRTLKYFPPHVQIQLRAALRENHNQSY